MKSSKFSLKIVFMLVLMSINLVLSSENDAKTGKKKSWKDKDIRDMSDADMERILDEWEANEEPLEPDELPEHLRPSPKIDLSKLDTSDPESILKMTKKGKSVMMFVDIKPEISVIQADITLRIWHTSLQNNHIIAERYPIEDRRAIFLFPDGAQAVDAKNFLIEQPELAHVTLEGQVFQGQYAVEDAKVKATEESQKTEL